MHPSLWLEQVAGEHGSPPVRRPPVTGPVTTDVVIVGAGFTGLWTAYYLLRDHPGLDVLVLEAATVGFGASGRNGGWCSALFPASASAIARRHGERAARDLRAAMRDTVDEVGSVAADEGIDCGFARGGTVVVARSRPQLDRLRAEAAEARRWGDATEVLTTDEARGRLDAAGTRGGLWSPDCARIQPARLVTGLAAAVERMGGRIAEGSRVVSVRPGGVSVAVEDDAGGAPAGAVPVRARQVVRATEAWTARLPGHGRALAPVYSLMIATEPLPASTWARIGLADHETFADGRHLIVYGQRTVDDRIAFGGRGAPYHWRSSIRPAYEHEPSVLAALRRTLVQLLPVLDGVRITHRWGGPLGIPRDWHASVGLGPDGVGWAGGYVGDGVATTNLAGRTLADLLTGRRSALTALPWVHHRSPRWEPEPLRWLGVNAALQATRLADAEERLTGRRSTVARLTARLTGH